MIVWFVPDLLLADTVRTALVAEWPDREVRVEVGARPADASGIEWDGAVVRVWDATGARSAPAADARVAVLLVRTWTVVPEPAAAEATWVPPAPVVPPPAVVIPDPPAPTADRTAFAAGLGSRWSSDEPIRLDRARLVAEATRGRLFADLSLYAGFGADSTRFVERRHPGERAVELPIDRAAASLVGGWRGEGPLVAYAWAGPEVRLLEWWLYVDGVPAGGRNLALGASLLAGTGVGVAAGPIELRALPYLRTTAPEPHAAVGLYVDALWRER